MFLVLQRHLVVVETDSEAAAIGTAVTVTIGH